MAHGLWPQATVTCHGASVPGSNWPDSWGIKLLGVPLRNDLHLMGFARVPVHIPKRCQRKLVWVEPCSCMRTRSRNSRASRSRIGRPLWS